MPCATRTMWCWSGKDASGGTWAVARTCGRTKCRRTRSARRATSLSDSALGAMLCVRKEPRRKSALASRREREVLREGDRDAPESPVILPGQVRARVLARVPRCALCLAEELLAEEGRHGEGRFGRRAVGVVDAARGRVGALEVRGVDGCAQSTSSAIPPSTTNGATGHLIGCRERRGEEERGLTGDGDISKSLAESLRLAEAVVRERGVTVPCPECCRQEARSAGASRRGGARPRQ